MQTEEVVKGMRLGGSLLSFGSIERDTKLVMSWLNGVLFENSSIFTFKSFQSIAIPLMGLIAMIFLIWFINLLQLNIFFHGSIFDLQEGIISNIVKYVTLGLFIVTVVLFLLIPILASLYNVNSEYKNSTISKKIILGIAGMAILFFIESFVIYSFFYSKLNNFINLWNLPFYMGVLLILIVIVFCVFDMQSFFKSDKKDIRTLPEWIFVSCLLISAYLWILYYLVPRIAYGESFESIYMDYE